MKSAKVNKFLALAGHRIPTSFDPIDEPTRILGAQLLLSEVLEYIVHGLGVVPEINGTKVTNPNDLHFHTAAPHSEVDMLDGLADVAYTMYWNALAFGLPLEEAFEVVCDNNLEKFVKLGSWASELTELPREGWDCRCGVSWPPEVVRVEVISVQGESYAVGKDSRGKVRKPSSYRPVDLRPLCTAQG